MVVILETLIPMVDLVEGDLVDMQVPVVILETHLHPPTYLVVAAMVYLAVLQAEALLVVQLLALVLMVD
jgi:hypothetical protein